MTIVERSPDHDKNRGTGRTTAILKAMIRHLEGTKNNKAFGDNVAVFVVKDSREYSYIRVLAHQHCGLMAYNAVRNTLIFPSGEVRLMAESDERLHDRLRGLRCPIYVDHHADATELLHQFPHNVVNPHTL